MVVKIIKNPPYKEKLCFKAGLNAEKPGIFNNNWINVKCIGTSSNSTAIGTKVRAKAHINGTPTWQLRQVSGCTGFNAQNSFNVEFGLGDAAIIDSLIFEWPSGLVDFYVNVDVGYFYEAVEGIGLNPILSAIPASTSIPAKFELHQNYPNPFNPSTTIKYSLATGSNVEIKIYNLLGRHIRTLVSEFQTTGTRTVVWDGRDHLQQVVSSGIYLYRIRAGNLIETRKMAFVR